ncbi:MAG: isoprenylcysteine carboxylmethyltransferase family protein [Hyphomonadaceae bacterium]|nr:isoprenylcysteine carboxylmethyltransferase family protein [Hyphomonadaceae bacterium]
MTYVRETSAPIALGGLAAATYGALAYVFFFGTFLYLIGFVVGAPFLPKTIDSGLAGSPWIAALVNLGALLLFGVQHSVMARPAFKQWWASIVPPVVERSTFVVAASAVLCLLVYVWQPMPENVWTVTNPTAANALWALSALGWGTVLLSTFLINHFELFGLQQVFHALIGHRQQPMTFKTPMLYRYVRHPLYLGFVIAFFTTPVMSQGHLLFAIAGTAYILVGIFFEERDLVRQFGETYRRYQQRVPMLFPFFKKIM